MREETPLWCDDRLRVRRPERLRQLHLDFHNSEHVADVAHRFDPARFGDALLRSGVGNVVLFAKDMHGFFYHPTASGPVHPGLRRPELLGEQIDACRERGIGVLVYYCTTWDNHLARTRPEWRIRRRDGSDLMPGEGEAPGWTGLCLARTEFVDLMLEHTTEFLRRYDVDGVWFDTPVFARPPECFCPACRTAMADAGLDVRSPADQREHKERLVEDWLRRARETVAAVRPGAVVEHNQMPRSGLPRRAPLLDGVEIEGLPGGEWNYYYFPVMVRHARALGLPTVGITGRFHYMWGDFGGLRHVEQLKLEAAGFVMEGAGVSVGDQLHPSGVHDEGVVATLAPVFDHVREVEEYLLDVAPVVEVALAVGAPPLTDFARVEMPGSADGPLVEGVLGTAKLLSELHLQYDVVELGAGLLGRYRLVVVPDGTVLTEAQERELRDHAARGGRVLAGRDAVSGPKGAAWLPWELRLEGDSPFDPCYVRLEEEFAAGLPPHDFALYGGSARWTLDAGGPQALGRLGEPAFQRSGERWTSHAQAPLETVTAHPALLADERVAAVAFSLGAAYWRTGYWVYREVFDRLLRRLLPEPLLTTTAPRSTQLSVMSQAGAGGPAGRWLVHLTHFTAGRRSPDHLDHYEEPLPLHDVTVTLRGVPGRVAGVRAVRGGTECGFRQRGDVVEFRVGRVLLHEICALTFAAAG